MFQPDLKSSPPRARFSVWRLNAEKVVYPPQSPTMKNSRVVGLTRRRPSVPVKVAKNPIRNDPVTLIRSVPHGKVSPKRLATHPEAQKRAMPPRALPIAIHAYVFMETPYRALPLHDVPCSP